MENWKPVVGHEGYEVSDLGRVKSHHRGGRILRPQMRNNSLSGHHYVVLRGVRKSVHHLVLEAFVGPRPAGMQARHANDNGTDNVLTNLSWGTQSGNAYDCIDNGNHPNRRKTKCPKGHDYSPENTYVYTVKSGSRKGHVHRDCKICIYERTRASRARRAA